MRTILAVVTGLLVVTNAGAEPQPGITQIVPRVSQLGVLLTIDTGRPVE